jgi:hypothetical protein
MEKAFFEALMSVALSERKDQWGNTIQSPLTLAVNKWTDEKKEEIAKLVVKNLGEDELAKKISDNVIRSLSSINWADIKNKENIVARVNEIVAQKLAEEQLEKFKQII